MNLFSSFDPWVLGLSVNWLSSFLGLLIFSCSFWLSKSQILYFFQIILNFILLELSNLMDKSKILILLSLFLFILMNNFLGLFPYIFTSSTHLVFGLSLSFPVWLGHMFYSYLVQPDYMLAHLVPLGTPGVLQPFMVLIELVSNVIRPVTLGIRLMANMMAGHLLLTLLGLMTSSGWFVLGLVLCGMLMILILELSVALIQAYVFTILSSLYVAEVNSIKINKLNFKLF